MRPWLVVQLEKPEAMSQISLSVRRKKLSNAPSLTSLLIMLWLPSVGKPIPAMAWLTGLLAGGGGTTTAVTLAAMIE